LPKGQIKAGKGERKGREKPMGKASKIQFAGASSLLVAPEPWGMIKIVWPKKERGEDGRKSFMDEKTHELGKEEFAAFRWRRREQMIGKE
jgi:hypothetical protein